MTEARNVPARPGRVTSVKPEFEARCGRDRSSIKAGLLMTARLCVARQASPQFAPASCRQEAADARTAG